MEVQVWILGFDEYLVLVDKEETGHVVIKEL